MNIDNDKYLQDTKNGKVDVVFPSSIKNPRRLGRFDSRQDAIEARDAYLREHALVETEMSPVDILTGKGNVIIGLYDLHYPYQDERSIGIAKQVIQDVKPDTIIFGGDVIDFYKLSRFSQDEKRAKSVQEELDAWYDGAVGLQECAKDANWYLTLGNHEYRLTSYLQSNNELSSLRALELDSLLRLDELGIIKAQEVQYLNRELVFIHGNRVSINPGSAVKSEIKIRAWQQSVIQGHEHRIGSFIQNGPLRCIRGYSVGCLCQEPWYDTSTTFWQRGLIVITINNGDFEAELVRINDGHCVFRGKVYSG